MEPLTDATEQAKPRLAIVKTIIQPDMVIRIGERRHDVDEGEAPFPQTPFALGRIQFEEHFGILRHWPIIEKRQH